MTSPRGRPDGGFDWHGDRPDPDFDWRAEREHWRRRRREARRRRDGRPFGRGGVPPFGCVGCVVIVFVLVVGSTAAFGTWVVASVFGFLAPRAGPSAGAGFGIAVILLLAILVSIRAFAVSVRPLASLADATTRLADGEGDVRVAVRGPRPVRDLAVSFNAMAERLDRSRADRQAMLADVTHELRTPLTVIGGGLEAMLDNVHPMDEEDRKNVV